MQLEWNRFLDGLLELKEEQGLLWLFCAVVLVVCLKHAYFRKQEWPVACIVLGVLVLFPITAVVLLKVYTPFYNWKDLQQLFPLVLLVAFGAVELYGFLKKQDVPGVCIGQHAKNIISGVCVIVCLLVATNFRGLEQGQKAEEHGIPLESAEVFEALWQVIGEEPVVLAAPPEMLQYARLYEPAWRPVYGRDLWSGKSASYVNSGYDWEHEYYTLLEDARLPEEECESLIFLINEGKADCIIVPDFWLEIMSGMPEYDSVRLTSSYIGIMKKDLLVK